MPELRWALIGLGAVFLVGLVLWEWRRSRRRSSGTGLPESPAEPPRPVRPRRIEPGIEGMVASRHPDVDESFDVPTIHPMEQVSVVIAPERAVDVPSAVRVAPVVPKPPEPASAPEPVEVAQPDVPPPPRPVVEIIWPPPHAGRVLGLRLLGATDKPLAGRRLRLALEGAGFVPGPQIIYHRADARGAVLMSVANLVRPGDLDPATMDAQEFRGIHLFSILPGPLPNSKTLDELVAVARALAQRLDMVVQDDRGLALDADRLQQIRQTLPDQDAVPGDGKAP